MTSIAELLVVITWRFQIKLLILQGFNILLKQQDAAADLLYYAKQLYLFAPIGCHDFQEIDRANNIVVIIKQRFLHTLTHSFQPRKVNNSIKTVTKSKWQEFQRLNHEYITSNWASLV